MSKGNFLMPLLIIICIWTISCNSGTSNEKPAKDAVVNKINSDPLKPQYDESKIHGIGFIKIGMTWDSLKLILNSKHPLKYKEESEERDQYGMYNLVKENNVLIKLLPPAYPKEARSMIPQSHWCKNVATYFISNTKFDKTEVNYIYCTFYDNKLVKIHFEFSKEIDDIIEAKYGKADSTFSMEGHFEQKWFNKDITLEYKRSKYSSDNGFNIYTKGVEDLIKKCDLQVIDSLNKAYDEKLKTENKSF